MSDPIKHVSDWLKPSEESKTNQQERLREEEGYKLDVSEASSVDISLESLDDHVTVIGDVNLTAVDVDLTDPDQDGVDFDIDPNEDNTLTSDPDVLPIHFEFGFNNPSKLAQGEVSETSRESTYDQTLNELTQRLEVCIDYINKLERRLCQIELEQRNIEAKLRELGE